MPLLPLSPDRREQRRGSPAREVFPLQRELGRGQRGRGGPGRHHGETELRGLLPALQARALCPVGAAVRKGG